MPTMGKSMCHVSKEQLIQIRDILDNMINNNQEHKHGDWKKVDGVGEFPDDDKKDLHEDIDYPYPDVSWDEDKKQKWDGSDIY